MAHAESRLLQLPRELRDEIYRIYLFAGDGYVYDFRAACLRMPDGNPIDLALMRTCQRVHDEMRGLALRLNTVIFSTLYADDLRTRAARWNWVARSALQSTSDSCFHAVKHMS